MARYAITTKDLSEAVDIAVQTVHTMRYDSRRLRRSDPPRLYFKRIPGSAYKKRVYELEETIAWLRDFAPHLLTDEAEQKLRGLAEPF